VRARILASIADDRSDGIDGTAAGGTRVAPVHRL